jgi:hypothetical protein
MGNQSPVYFYLAWAASEAWGGGEAALRSPSLVAGIALIPCCAFAVWHWTRSQSAALLAALLAAIDRNCIFYAQEARPYACVQLAALLHLLLFWRLLSAPSGRLRLAFVGGAGLLFYLHYTAVLLLAAEAALYALLWLRRAWRPAYPPSLLAFDLAGAALLFLPASPHLREIAARRRNWELFVRPWVSRAMAGPAVAHLAAPGLIALTLAGVRRARGRRPWLALPDGRVVLLAACWLAVPLTVAWLLTYTKAACLFHVRYVIVSALAPMLAAGLCCACCPTRAGRSLVALGALSASVYMSGMATQLRLDGRLLADRHEDWRAAVELVNRRHAHDALPVMVRSGLIEADGLLRDHDEAFREYCLLPVLGLYRIDRPRADLAPLPTTRWRCLEDEIRERIWERGGAWLLAHGGSSTADAVISRVLHDLATAEVAVRCVERRPFGYVTVARIRVERRNQSHRGRGLTVAYKSKSRRPPTMANSRRICSKPADTRKSGSRSQLLAPNT